MNSVKILHAVRSAITAIAELLVCHSLLPYRIIRLDPRPDTIRSLVRPDPAISGNFNTPRPTRLYLKSVTM